MASPHEVMPLGIVVPIHRNKQIPAGRFICKLRYLNNILFTNMEIKVKYLTGLLFLAAILFYNTISAQEWVYKYCEEQNLMNDMNKIASGIYGQMQKSIGSKAPNLVFQKLENNNLVSLDSIKENVIIINFWSTSCSACRMQLPDLSKLQEKYYSKGLRVIYVSTDVRDSLIKFLSKNKIEGIKGYIEESKLMYPYQAFAEPSAYLLDKEGIIRYAWLTPEKLELLEKHIQPYIAWEE